MDIHPIVVHFPIAFLTLYSLFELASIKKLQEKSYWFYIKAVLVISGEIGALLAILSGKIIDRPEGVRTLEMHENFAIITAVIFGALAIAYTLAWFGKGKSTIISARLVFNRWITAPLALLGLASVFITAGIGGAMVYGSNFDPFMAPILKILGIE